MPYVSVRTKSGARVGGGPLFWLIVGPFIAMYYLVLWTFAAAFMAAAFLIAFAHSALHRPNAAPPAVAREQQPDPADAVPAPQDAVPPLRQRLRDPHTRNRFLAASLLAAVLAALLVAAIVSGARYR